MVYASDRTRSATYSHVVRVALGPLPEMVLQVGASRGRGALVVAAGRRSAVRKRKGICACTGRDAVRGRGDAAWRAV